MEIMFQYKMPLIITLAIISLPAFGAGPTEARQQQQPVTYRLDEGKLTGLSEQTGDRYRLEVAQIKQLLNTNKGEELNKALLELKKDFPEIAGADLDAFIGAETLYCEGKFVSAVRAYDKLLAEFPESALYEAALDRQFTIATAYLAGHKKPILGIFKMKGYAEGEKIMERISNRTGDAPISVKANLAIADGLEKRAKFNEAYHKWSEIHSRWPTGKIAKDALLGMARCKHSAYKGPKYDPSNLVSAKSYYENFKLRYPKDARDLDVDAKLKQINEQLAYKQFSIGKYYQKAGQKQSANLYYQTVLDNWPDSSAAKLAAGEIEGIAKK